MDSPDPRPGRTAVHGALPLILLALFALRHYGYEAFPAAIAARVWNIHGAMVMLTLLAGVTAAWAPPSGTLRTVFVCTAAWWGVEELLVIGCNTWWILAPWAKPAGASACYPILHFDMGKIGALVAAVALAYIVRQRNL